MLGVPCAVPGAKRRGGGRVLEPLRARGVAGGVAGRVAPVILPPPTPEPHAGVTDTGARDDQDRDRALPAPGDRQDQHADVQNEETSAPSRATSSMRRGATCRREASDRGLDFKFIESAA